jgi:hypothetical protein
VSGSDCAWVDYIELPGFADYTLAVNAGQDAEICEGATFQANAMAANYLSLSWATSGTGTFNNNLVLNPVYTPGAEDYLQGMVVLSLTVFGEGGQSLTDVLQLSFNLLPLSPGQISGPATVCFGNTESYNVGAVMYADSYVWVLSPAEAGLINGNTNVANISFTEGYTGQATLKVQGMNDCGEGVFSEEFAIQVDDCTGIGDISNEASFTISPNPSAGIFTLKLNSKSASADQIVVKDALGKVVYSGNADGSQYISVDLNFLEDGLYFIIVKGEQLIHSAKLIIKK